MAGAADFVRGGLAAGNAVVVATIPANLRGLRRALGIDASRVALVDMSELGRNPGRILPVWREFARNQAAAGRRARGIGEPVWAGRAPEELDECCRHEALINTALHGADSGFWLLCPYDSTALERATLAAVEWTHPRLYDGRRGRSSRDFRPTLGDAAFDGELVGRRRTRGASGSRRARSQTCASSCEGRPRAAGSDPGASTTSA